MKTKEELLKVYSAYLPYGLEFKLPLSSERYESIIENCGWTHVHTLETAIDSGHEDAIQIRDMILKQKSPQLLFDDGELFLGQMVTNLGFEEDDVYLNEVKPILYSMDMLTHPIEYKGETFVPIDWLESNFNAFYYAQDTRFGSLLIKRKNTSMYHDVLQLNQIVNKLLEWHFNVFSLEENKYIKKENL